MTINAYITAGSTVIPCLIPTQRERDVARQIGIDERDLFSLDVPCGMTRWTRGSFLVASTQMSALYSAATVRLDLNDGSGTSITIRNLYARPPQPFQWRQSGGLVLVELVDERWWWRFSTAAVMAKVFAPLWSSDGRWQVNGSDALIPITDWTEMLTELDNEAALRNLTAPIGWISRVNRVRRMSDLIASPNISLAMFVDAVAAATYQPVISTGIDFRYYSQDELRTDYDNAMKAYGRAMLGGMGPTLSNSANTDALVSQWSQYGWQNRCPQKARVTMPERSVEGMTWYNNVAQQNWNIPRKHFPYEEDNSQAAALSFTAPRIPADIGEAQLTESSVVVLDDTGSGVLTDCPGWFPPTVRDSARINYTVRMQETPFGRTVWAGWIPWFNGTTTIGQIGCVSYRLVEVDGVLSPVTISECKESDWRFGIEGIAESEPSNVVTGKGLAHAYKNCLGMTIMDVAPPMTRVFPARITASAAIGPWKWKYSFVEMEPDPTISSTVAVGIGGYARTGDLIALNMAEYGNNLGLGIIAPGVQQAFYPNATIQPVPISAQTIVMMCEQFPTSYVTNQCEQFPPAYWFSMPNAIEVTCIP